MNREWLAFEVELRACAAKVIAADDRYPRRRHRIASNAGCKFAAGGEERDLALRTACRLYDLGRTRAERLALAAKTTRLAEMRDPSVRASC